MSDFNWCTKRNGGQRVASEVCESGQCEHDDCEHFKRPGVDLTTTIMTMGGIVENVLRRAEEQLQDVLRSFGEVRVTAGFRLSQMSNGTISLEHKISFVKDRFVAKDTTSVDPRQAKLFDAVEKLRPKPGSGCDSVAFTDSKGRGTVLHADGRTEAVGE